MTRKYVLLALLFGAGVGLTVAAVMTFLEWRLNPGGIFHGAEGTNWSFVMDTALSWFGPVFVFASVLALPVAIWLSRRNGSS